MPIRKGFNLSFCPLALDQKDILPSMTYRALLSQRDGVRAWWSPSLGIRELHLVFVQDTAWRRVVPCRQQLPWYISRTSPAASCVHRVFFRNPQAFHKCHGALLTRFPETHSCFLHCRVDLRLKVPQELLPTVRVEGAREL